MVNKKFKKIMQERGYKVATLAKKIGVSDTSVRHWLKGRNRPSIKQVIEMSKLFKMEIQDVYEMFSANEYY